MSVPATTSETPASNFAGSSEGQPKITQAPRSGLWAAGDRACCRALLCSAVLTAGAVVAVIPGAIIFGMNPKQDNAAGIALLTIAAAFALSCVACCCVAKKVSGN